jgi:hypothetical protein
MPAGGTGIRSNGKRFRARSAVSGPTDDPETIRSVSSQLHVSVSSLVDRLYNLGEITMEDRDRLRARPAA